MQNDKKKEGRSSVFLLFQERKWSRQGRLVCTVIPPLATSASLPLYGFSSTALTTLFAHSSLRQAQTASTSTRFFPPVSEHYAPSWLQPSGGQGAISAATAGASAPVVEDAKPQMNEYIYIDKIVLKNLTKAGADQWSVLVNFIAGKKNDHEMSRQVDKMYIMY